MSGTIPAICESYASGLVAPVLDTINIAPDALWGTIGMIYNKASLEDGAEEACLDLFTDKLSYEDGPLLDDLEESEAALAELNGDNVELGSTESEFLTLLAKFTDKMWANSSNELAIIAIYAEDEEWSTTVKSEPFDVPLIDYCIGADIDWALGDFDKFEEADAVDGKIAQGQIITQSLAAEYDAPVTMCDELSFGFYES